MAEGFNRVYLLGTLAERPELRYTRKGRAVLRMRMGVDETYRDSEGNETTRTNWHALVLPGGRAEALADAIGPGTGLLIEGILRTRSYQARDGTERTFSEIVVRNALVVSGAARASRPSQSGLRFGMPETPWDEPVFSDDGQGKLF